MELPVASRYAWRRSLLYMLFSLKLLVGCSWSYLDRLGFFLIGLLVVIVYDLLYDVF